MRDPMAVQDLAAVIGSLTPEEQDAVRLFIEFIKRTGTPQSEFLAVVDEFIDQHPDLLQRLAR
jgi:hypothetical protein